MSSSGTGRPAPAPRSEAERTAAPSATATSTPSPEQLQRMGLGEILISRGLIARRTLDLCLAAQKKSRKKIGQLLVDNDYIGEDELFPVLAVKLDMEYRRLRTRDVDRQVASLVSLRFAQRHLVLPLRLDHVANVLEVAIADPTDVQLHDMLDSVAAAQGATLRLVLSAPTRIKEAIRRAYALDPPK